jgi:hypothetical protein
MRVCVVLTWVYDNCGAWKGVLHSELKRNDRMAMAAHVAMGG